MKKLGLFLFNVSVMAVLPVVAGAAGTYYNGNLYKNPQNRYGTGGTGYYNSYTGGRGYGQPQYTNNQATMVRTTTTKKKTAKAVQKQKESRKQGFALDLDFSHEFASWNFEMKSAGSKLYYNDLSWNVLSAEGAYYFGDTTPMQVKAGLRYGKQFDESPMVDDDITNGAYAYQDIAEGREYGHAMSLGTSKGGTQMGFNVEFGLTDYFTWGRVKATPSIGYRYFKHELKTENNYGLTMDTFSGNTQYVYNDGTGDYPYVSCINAGGEKQCDPLIILNFYNGSNDLGSVVAGRIRYQDENNNTVLSDITAVIPSGSSVIGIDLGDTYYYEQSGISHKYETEWAGPYLALDMEYMIDEKNLVGAGIEFGLPVYDSKGDQPYRIDWAHPTSVEDKGSFGDAYHLGLNALWSTQVSESVNFTLGLTYDFYKVTGATAKTYLNGTYYQAFLDDCEANYSEVYNNYDEYVALGYTAAELNAYLADLQGQIDVLNSQKSAGWSVESSGEIDSIYKAMGVRAGVNIKF